MKASAYNWKDIQKYYDGTFILVPEATNKILFVEKVDPNYIYVRDIDGEHGGIELTKTGYTIQDILPHKQFYQPPGDFAYMIQRKPARMWKKGLHTENTHIVAITGTGGHQAQGCTHTQLEKFHQYRGKFPSLDALPNYKSIALSERICLLDNGNLLMDSFCVGLCNPNKKKIVVMKELASCLPKQNLWGIVPV